MASSVVVKEHTMRRNDFSGDHEASGAWEEMMDCSCARCEAVKTSGFVRFCGAG